MPLTTPLKWFKPSEFKHPELMNDRAAVLLDTVRDYFGKVMIVTDDARPTGNMPPGASPTSLHFKGQAFDIRSRNWTVGDKWLVQSAIHRVAHELPMAEKGIELEWVESSTDKHLHIGFFLDGRPSRLLLRLE